MIEIDHTRFEKLLDAISAASALIKGYNGQLAELEHRRNSASADLARAEQLSASMPFTRPDLRLPSGVAPPQTIVRDSAENRERALQPARDELAALDRELKRINEQAGVAFERLNRLRRLEAACRAWAAERDIVLPGSASGEGRATVQSSPRGREFIAAEATPRLPTGPTSTPTLRPGIDSKGVLGRLRGMMLP